MRRATIASAILVLLEGCYLMSEPEGLDASAVARDTGALPTEPPGHIVDVGVPAVDVSLPPMDPPVLATDAGLPAVDADVVPPDPPAASWARTTALPSEATTGSTTAPRFHRPAGLGPGTAARVRRPDAPQT